MLENNVTAYLVQKNVEGTWMWFEVPPITGYIPSENASAPISFLTAINGQDFERLVLRMIVYRQPIISECAHLHGPGG